jgi:hypothetical protein
LFKDFTCTGGAGLSFYEDDDALSPSLQEIKVKALARTYVQAAQGNLESLKFDTSTGNFTTEITIDGNVHEPTLIYVYNAGKGDKWYESIKIDLDAPEECQASAAVSDNLVTVTVDEAACDGQLVTIDIYRPELYKIPAMDEDEDDKLDEQLHGLLDEVHDVESKLQEVVDQHDAEIIQSLRYYQML